MCLNSRMSSMEEILNHIPGDEFVVFKVLDKQGEHLRSPHYGHQIWAPGEVVADCRNRDNGDAGLYCFLVEPHPNLILRPGGDHKKGGNRLVRMTAKKEDIVWGGHDEWNGKKGICLVLKKVHLSQEDYERALSDKAQEYLVEEVKIQAKKDVETAKEHIEEQREIAEEAVGQAEIEAEKVAETKKKVGKKTVTKAKKTVAKTKKGAKKTAKKPDGKKVVAKAKKAVKKKTTAKMSTSSKMTAGKRLADKAKSRVKKREPQV